MESQLMELMFRYGESRRWFDLDEYYLWHYCNGSIFYAVKSNRGSKDDAPPYIDVFDSHYDAVKYTRYYSNLKDPGERIRVVEVVINPRPQYHRVGNRFMPCSTTPSKHTIDYHVFSDSGVHVNAHPHNLQEALEEIKALGEGWVYISENDQVEGILKYNELASIYKW